MASTPRRVPTTPPSPSQPVAASKSRIRKPSAKVLEAQQSLRTRTATRRLAQDDEHTIAVRAPQRTGQPAAPQVTQEEAPARLIRTRPVLSEGETRVDGSNELARLVASLTETIAQQSRIITAQSSVIENIRNDLAVIRTDQQRFETQHRPGHQSRPAEGRKYQTRVSSVHRAAEIQTKNIVSW
ncbi:hypothetical protein EJ04DRAFT_557947 [Polyplosphaeria fusca]|uniref:Uncharacterized protein n=1 Tax=Polyplosphaeria fusca TaxID=682080 RepID=A0A9P4QIK5_9PLEO|nr:hypothetical protein EJ04DRAFT_557947 [Polyplosphaeria fusca]